MKRTDRFFTWKSSDEIEGLDDSMIDPAWIPYGWTQKYVDGEYRISTMKGMYGQNMYSQEDLENMYLKGYRVVFDRFIKIASPCEN